MIILHLNLTKQDVLDLHRIIVQITNIPIAENPEIECLTVWASNTRSSVTINLPVLENEKLVYSTGRLLQPIHKDDVRKDRNQILTIIIRSRIEPPIGFTIQIKTYDRGQYLVPWNFRDEFSLPHQHIERLEPLAYRIPTSGIPSLYIKLLSEDGICSLVIISNYTDDIYENGGYDSINPKIRKTTFLHRFDLVIRKEDLSDPILLYIFILPDDSQCHGKVLDAKAPRKKRVDVSFNAQFESSYILPISLTALVFSLPIIFMVGYFLYLLIKSKKTPREFPPLSINLDSSLRSSSGNQNNDMEMTNLSGDDNSIGLNQNATIVSPPEVIANRENEKHWKNTDYQFLHFLLPVLIQGGLQYYEWSISNNSDELCFHNYACAREWKGFRSFNHMISNIGYAINSMIYLAFIYLRKQRFYNNLGVYHNHPIEISLSLAMLCQSIGSFIYHICPNKYAYNFDTPFMQTICVLAILKLYGSRHGPVSQRTCHISIAIIMALNVLIGASSLIFLSKFWYIFVLVPIIMALVYYKYLVKTKKISRGMIF
ncbi:hypothetical protein WR25_07871 isoform D [Diploscapter pachys]|uniref:SID1 transmembrane family member 1 n=1 Tax=Diploscapter pachys TaxID=2018661 RepID=A0A2A2LH55_9BILA|nr:hypothetical protein WR25_07871 isoform B [Diploscapter pachys]PAV85429.1 hypothetical protein WR25_07871 isoform C [Diploscapter pachys]PAV85430.1 hypothetical protein WR25_07871 isoform D [Diploscapter pachys]